MFILGNDKTLDKASQPPPEASRRPPAPMWGNVLKTLRDAQQIGPQLEVRNNTGTIMHGSCPVLTSARLIVCSAPYSGLVA